MGDDISRTVPQYIACRCPSAASPALVEEDIHRGAVRREAEDRADVGTADALVPSASHCSRVHCLVLLQRVMREAPGIAHAIAAAQVVNEIADELLHAAPRQGVEGRAITTRPSSGIASSPSKKRSMALQIASQDV